MEEKIDLNVPKGWHDMSDNDLKFFYELISSELFTPIQARCTFLMWRIGIKHLSYDAEKGESLLQLPGNRFIVATNDEILSMTEELKWLEDIPVFPVRISRIQKREALHPLLYELTFEQYTVLDNLFQGYLQTQNPYLLLQMGGMLYPYGDRKREMPLRPEAETNNLIRFAAKCFRKELPTGEDWITVNVFMWWGSFKKICAIKWPHFFKNSGENPISRGANRKPTAQEIRDSIDIQIRALTKGDITKEQEIMQSPVHRALTELDALARESEELRKIAKRK